MSRPLIAVTTRPRGVGEVKGWSDTAGAVLQATYAHALWRAGCDEALMFPRCVSDADAERYLARVDGLLLVGGGDVDPARYGEIARPEVYGVEHASDELELALARAAVRNGVPVLAICRGMQVLNVALGGTLDQHITGREGALDHGAPGSGRALHGVEVEAGSRLAKALGGARRIDHCYSSHHQAIGRVADGLTVTGHSDDGLVEAVELSETGTWVVGIQWHAERTAGEDGRQQAIFDAFAQFAGKRLP